ncbi:MAG TPA: lipoprotein insertase outer membrane protein LolB [Gammaproteobacteria bacterium]|nr:lipoprotein insertase outer membrane protein LolB [Gammaproteobacteria bacterium]
MIRTGHAARRYVLTLAAALLAAALGACTGVPPKPIGPPNQAAWQQRLTRLATLGDWRLSGRIAVDNGSRGGSGSIDWVEHAPRFEMRFAGPFGLGGFRLYGTPSAIFIDTGDKTYYAADPEHALAKRLGGPLPVASLRYWALGMPDPEGRAQTRVDQDGLLRNLQQHGWTVEYRNYGTFDGWRLPTRLEARRGQTKIKLVVEGWKVPAGVQN